MTFFGAESARYKVVVNDEGQYSIWLAHRANAPGWRDAGRSGSKEECLGFVREVWVDMRPLSLQRHMQAMEANPVCPA